MKTSESHSQANHGFPAIVNEKTSVVGTRPLFNIHSPARICQPVSESVSSHPTPVVDQNSTTIGIKKARSDNDGKNEPHESSREVALAITFGCSSVPAPNILPLS
jgi:hypothetical protein